MNHLALFETYFTSFAGVKTIKQGIIINHVNALGLASAQQVRWVSSTRSQNHDYSHSIFFLRRKYSFK